MMSPYERVQMRPTLSFPNLTFDVRFSTFEREHQSQIRHLVLSDVCVHAVFVLT